MHSLDCPACGRVDAAELTGLDSEARCRACLHRFVFDPRALTKHGFEPEKTSLIDPEFVIASKSKSNARRQRPRWALLIPIVMVVLAALWIFGTARIHISTTQSLDHADPAAAADPSESLTAEDARPSAAPAPLVDPSPFRRMARDRR